MGRDGDCHEVGGKGNSGDSGSGNSGGGRFAGAAGGDDAAHGPIGPGARTAAPLVLMGHSLGAATALTLTLENRGELAGLVVCGTPRRIAAAQPDPGLATLAVHGADDRRAPIDTVRLWTAARKSVDLREYADAGHDLLHEPVHARVTADIAEWVGRICVPKDCRTLPRSGAR
ncbi:hypothetical protein GCM10011591_17760 [Nocardia camponoti]|uniref:Serine aminopeptidase S33 domain-containing protein n=1 Tax=Nocardia camponoti TaxID=1616106 RepID=A0A917QFU5_9NOCA|nr:hypothetical protein GCM10011591_17760 [Nocardia camponoti]